ncbi:MlaD family protein [Vampirovibrio chlorellavorus]|uniref:MlaD family protein n=1 Tax=Vampirovibrio chlorellavorus TaxID=758823 RepID=UPI0026F13C07|nr:MlaD family protein [Vampirovibrio chlorellavorus]
MKINRFLKSINQKVPLDRAIISDLLLWALMAALLLYGLYMVAIVLPAKRGQTIHLEFLNANEISRGAPVRLMGTDIGFVDNIRIERDHVDVTIQTDPDAIQIPSGSVFTVLFTGLGGAKSIEVTLPETPEPPKDGKPVYRVKEPISMRDTLNASLDSVQALQKGSENISDFFGKRKPVEELQFNIREALAMSTVATRNTASLNRALGSLQKDVNTYTQEGIKTFQTFYEGANKVNAITQPSQLRPLLLSLDNDLDHFHHAFVREGKLAHQITHQLNRFNQRVIRFNNSLTRVGQVVLRKPLPQWLDDIERGQQTMDGALARLEQTFPAGKTWDLAPARQKVQQFNQILLDGHKTADTLIQKGVIKPDASSGAGNSSHWSPSDQARPGIVSPEADRALPQVSDATFWQPVWDIILFFFS